MLNNVPVTSSGLRRKIHLLLCAAETRSHSLQQRHLHLDARAPEHISDVSGVWNACARGYWHSSLSPPKFWVYQQTWAVRWPQKHANPLRSFSWNWFSMPVCGHVWSTEQKLPPSAAFRLYLTLYKAAWSQEKQESFMDVHSPLSTQIKVFPISLVIWLSHSGLLEAGINTNASGLRSAHPCLALVRSQGGMRKVTLQAELFSSPPGPNEQENDSANTLIYQRCNGEQLSTEEQPSN